jgi:hypothetical protein
LVGGIGWQRKCKSDDFQEEIDVSCGADDVHRSRFLQGKKKKKILVSIEQEKRKQEQRTFNRNSDTCEAMEARIVSGNPSRMPVSDTKEISFFFFSSSFIVQKEIKNFFFFFHLFNLKK